MWVDKYRPRSLKNVIGQQGDKSNANKLLRCDTMYIVHTAHYKALKVPSNGLMR